MLLYSTAKMNFRAPWSTSVPPCGMRLTMKCWRFSPPCSGIKQSPVKLTKAVYHERRWFKCFKRTKQFLKMFLIWHSGSFCCHLSLSGCVTYLIMRIPSFFLIPKKLSAGLSGALYFDTIRKPCSLLFIFYWPIWRHPFEHFAKIIYESAMFQWWKLG